MKQKVLILGKLPPPYMGPAIATEIILKSGLKDRYHLLHLDTRVNESLNDMGRWSLKKLIRYLRLYQGLISIIVRNRPSLVLIPISQSTIGFMKDAVLILISRLLGRKTIVQLRGSNFKTWLENSDVVTKVFVSFTLKRAQGVIVLGKKLRYLFEKIFPEDRIFVCPNGGNFPIRLAKKDHLQVKILYFANLQPSKGIEDLIQAISILSKQNSGFNVDVVGQWRSNEVKENCLHLTEKEGLPIHFHPPRSGAEKWRFFEKADIFVFPPREPEGHPWVIVEAMAAGLPIISTDRGAITESVVDGKNGFIVDAAHPEQIAGRLLQLINDPDLRQRMGNQSRRIYEERFTEEKMVENMSTIFDTVGSLVAKS